MAKKQTAAKTNLVSKGEIVTTTAAEPVKAETAKGESRGHYAATLVYGLTAEAIAEAITAGQLSDGGKTDVTISAKVTKTRDEFVTYDKLVALTFVGQALLAGGKEAPATAAPAEGKDERTEDQKAKGACDHFNYGFDLEVKRELRGKLAELIEGPAKAIAKAATTLLDQGVADTLEEAVAMVKAGRAKKGLPV